MNKEFDEFEVYDEHDDFESWEGDYILYQEENWPELLKLRKERALKDPSDLHAQEAYAIALNLNKKYEETIEFLRPIYRENWDCRFGVAEIIDALYALGKTEDDFDWIKKPEILKLGQDTIDFCREYLKNKRKPVSINDIQIEMIPKFDYIAFKDSDLVDFLLERTDLFEFSGNKEDSVFIEVKLKRQEKHNRQT